MIKMYRQQNDGESKVLLFHYHLSAVQLKKKIDQFFVTFSSNKIVLSQQSKTNAFDKHLRIKINDKILNDVSMIHSSFSNSKKLDC